jgi:hypothetical protein
VIFQVPEDVLFACFERVILPVIAGADVLFTGQDQVDMAVHHSRQYGGTGIIKVRFTFRIFLVCRFHCENDTVGYDETAIFLDGPTGPINEPAGAEGICVRHF